MKQIYGKIGLISLACLLVWSGMAFAANSPNLAPRKIEIKRGYTPCLLYTSPSPRDS